MVQSYKMHLIHASMHFFFLKNDNSLLRKGADSDLLIALRTGEG